MFDLGLAKWAQSSVTSREVAKISPNFEVMNLSKSRPAPG